MDHAAHTQQEMHKTYKAKCYILSRNHSLSYLLLSSYHSDNFLSMMVKELRYSHVERLQLLTLCFWIQMLWMHIMQGITQMFTRYTKNCFIMSRYVGIQIQALFSYLMLYEALKEQDTFCLHNTCLYSYRYL